MLRNALIALFSIVSLLLFAPSALAATSTFRDVATLHCLDSNTNGNVYTLRCNGGNFQKWRVERSAHRVVDVATGRCLDSNTANSVYTLPCNGGNFQNWYHN
jgi:hypothetical protein